MYLQTERCIHLKLLVWREPLFLLRICEQNSSVIIRFEILLRLFWCENFSVPWRNGPLDRHLKEAGSSISVAKNTLVVNSREEVEREDRFLREQDYGKRSRASKALSNGVEVLLWLKGLLSHILTQHFGLRGCQKHHDMYCQRFFIE